MTLWFRSAPSRRKQLRRRRLGDRQVARRQLQKALEFLERRELLAGDFGGLDQDVFTSELWRPAEAAPAARGSGPDSFLRASEFDTFALDDAELQSLLASAPLEFSGAGSAVEIALPNPDGTLSRFAIVESPVMAPELAAEFPEIKTFAGQGIDDPASTLRFDVTPAGLHAQVLAPDGSWYIDPYFHLDDSLYATYFSSSVVGDDLEFEEGLIEGLIPDIEPEGRGAVAGRGGAPLARSGTELRTYRAAVAATGEYTAFHGGTVASGQAAIVTAINRVTGIYENELAIRLQLVANNSTLVYTDAGTDPYTNDDGVALLGENQTNIDTLIGDANYDIGHVFTTGGGGLAGLGVVGVTGRKAEGETGLPNPIGDVFYVDFVAHEMGHQFGGNHTFNGDSGSCALNRNASTAYEPGSGSTIQAYAGICGDDNLQPNSDPYFHSVSFDEIVAFVDNVIPAVGTRFATGNTVPTVNAGLDYRIPANTPFVLTASGNDADGDILTYNWEQRDLGPQQDVNAGDNGSSPLFRSFPPTTEPSRTFPSLPGLLSNNPVIGETLPTTSRSMNFRATVRDNRSGGGAVNTDDMVVTTVDTGTPFQVTSPNNAATLPPSSTFSVTWDVAGTTGNGINAANVNILLSTDGGTNFDEILASNVPNDGAQNVFLPEVETTRARIKVEAVGNIFFDVSNSNFTISEKATLGVFVEQGGSPVQNGQVQNVTPNRQVTGAIEALITHPTDADIIYVASINGGIWKTTNATSVNPTWVAQTDELESLSMSAIAFDETDNTYERLAAGTGNYSSFASQGGSRGSVYVTDDGGDTWVNPGSQGIVGENISGIARSGDRIVVTSQSPGGIFVSDDKGATFTGIDSADFVSNGSTNFFDVVVDGSTPGRLYAAAEDRGIYRSDDFGSSWSKITGPLINAPLDSLITNSFNNNTEMAVHPVTGRLYVAVLQAGQPVGIFYTSDGDTPSPNWTRMDIPILPAGVGTDVQDATNTSPIQIQSNGHGLQSGDLVVVNGVGGNTAANGLFNVIRIDANNVFLNASAGNGTYTSGGQMTRVVSPNPTFKDIDENGSQGRIHFSIAVDLSDHNIVYVGGDRQDQPNSIGDTLFGGAIFRGDAKIRANPTAVPSPQWDHMTNNSVPFDTNGGTANNTGPHADSRDMKIDANGNLLEVDDGGIFRRTSPKDNTGDWFSLAGTLGVVEYHDIVYDNNSNIILGGTQDNGTHFQSAPDSLTWDFLSGGDGGDVAVDTVTLAALGQSIRYSSSQFLGGFRGTVWDADNNFVSEFRPTLIETDGTTLSPQFDTPIALNEVFPNRMIIGGSNGVYESFNQGDSIDNAGPGIQVTNLTSNPIAYGGRSAVNGDNEWVIYAGDVSGSVHVRTEAAGDFTTNIDIGTAVRDVRINPNEWMEAVALNSSSVHRTDDAGTTWTDISGDLSALGVTTLRSLEYISGAFEGIIVGTNMGVFATNLNHLGSWFEFGTGLPNVPVWDMDYDATDDVLVVGTLGRGSWKMGTASEFLNPNVTLDIDRATVPEDGSVPATVTVKLSRPSLDDVFVNLGFSGQATFTEPNGTGVFPDDYVRSASSVLIPAGSVEATVTITPLSDVLNEPAEQVTVDIIDVFNASEFQNQQVTTTILNDDLPPLVDLSVDVFPAEIGESGGQAIVTATLRNPLGGGALQPSGLDITIDLVASGIAIEGVDYLLADFVLTIPAGDTSASTTVTALDDVLDEFDETLTIAIDAVDFGVPFPGFDEVTIAIVDDDAEPNVDLFVQQLAIPENGGLATFVVRLDAVSAKDVTVNLGVSGTATSGVDFTGPALQVVIPAGLLSGTVDVVAIPDALDEFDETVTVDILSIVNGVENGVEQATTTILDDDIEPIVTLSVDEITIAESNGSAVFTATLNTVSAKDVTVDLGFSGTSSPADYFNPAAQIVIPAGALSATMTLNAFPDNLDEFDETVIVDIIGVTNGVESGTQSATTTIIDDDDEVTVTLDANPGLIVEGDTATFIATLNVVSAKDVTVNLGISGTALPGIDYITPATQIVIPAGSMSGSIDVVAIQDTTDENDETVTIEITSVINGVENGIQQDTATIVDDDLAPLVTLSIDQSTIFENGGNAVVTATLSAVSGKNVTVDLVQFGTATGGGVDYIDPSSIVIPAGSLFATTNIAAVTDAIDEFDETVVVDISGVSNGTEDGVQQASTTILDENLAPAVSLSAAPSTISENFGVATFTVTLDAVSAKDVTIDLGLGGSATGGGVDYVESGLQIFIPAGSVSGDVTITAAQDALDEFDETVVVDIRSVDNGIEVVSQQALTTIIDENDAPTVSLAISPDSIAEFNGVATITGTLSAVSAKDVTVDLGVGGTATGNGVDYFGPLPQLVIPAGSLTGTVSITAVHDTLDEFDETVIVDIIAVNNGGVENGVQQVTATIIDDDLAPQVTLSANPLAIAEDGGFSIFTLSLDAVSSKDVQVELAISGTATGGGVDFVDPVLQALIPAGALTSSVFILSVDDAIDEFDETVVVDIVSVTNGTEQGIQQASASIIDDDLGPVVGLQLITTSTISEDEGPAVFRAALSSVSAKDVVVSVGVSGTAIGGGVDFIDPAPQITIPAGSLTGTLVIDIVDDVLDEIDETLIVEITGVINGSEDGTQVASTTIADNDAAPRVTLSVDEVEIAEDGGVATFTASLDAVSSKDVTVSVNVSGAALPILDFVTTSPNLLIPAGSLSATFQVTAQPDLFDEFDELVTVDISRVVNAVEDGVQQQSTAILDDAPEPSVSISVNDPAISENAGSAVFTVTLSAVSGKDVIVDLDVDGSTATSGTDYIAIQSQVTIPAGSISASVIAVSLPDSLDEDDEQILVSIAGVTNAVESGVQFSSTIILDDDQLPNLTIQFDKTQIGESAETAELIANLSEVSGRDVTINFRFNGDAAELFDFNASASSIVIPAGETTGSITVTSIEDVIDELDETLVAVVDSIRNADGPTDQSATTTIVDNDLTPTVSLSFDQTSIPESGGVANVIASLSEVSGLDVVVTLGGGGSATDGIDYIAADAQILIPAGSLSSGVSIASIDDALDETDETVSREILAVTNAIEFGDQVATTTIADDDLPPAVTLNIDTAAISETGEVATIVASLSEVSGNDVTVDLRFDGTAVENVDYSVAARQVVVPAGSLFGSVDLTGVDDLLNENDESVLVSIDSLTNATSDGLQERELTITSDDAAPAVTLSVDLLTISEDSDTATVTANLDAVSGLSVTIDFGLAGTASGSGVDFDASSTQVVIPPGQTSGSFTITSVDDLLDELDESVDVTIANVANAIEASPQAVSVSIIDDDATPTVTFSLDTSLIDEANGFAIYTAELSAVSGNDVIVTTLFSGSADVSDFTASSNQIVIPAGSTTATLTIASIDDSFAELNEEVVITPDQISGATAANALPSTVTIVDDDQFPTIQLSSNVLDFPEGGSTPVTVSLSESAGRDVTINLSFSGSATISQDYEVSDSQVVIPAGQSSVAFTLTAIDDNLFEGAESIRIDAISPDDPNSVPAQAISLDIIDDEPTPSVALNIDTNSIPETGGSAIVTASLSGPVGTTVVIDLSFQGDPGLTAADFTASDNQIIIAPGLLSGTIGIQAVADGFPELDERLTTSVSSVSQGLTVSRRNVLTVIVDDDVAGITVTSDSTLILVSENGDSQTISVQLAAQPFTDVSLAIASSDETEVTVSTSSLQFTPDNWDTPQQFVVTGQPDLEIDGVISVDVVIQVDDAVSDPAFAGLREIVRVTNVDVLFNNLLVQEENGQLVVRDATTGNILKSEPISGGAPIVLDLSGRARQLSIGSLGSFAGTITVIHQSDDTVDYGVGWTAGQPGFVDGRYVHVLTRGASTLHIANDTPFKNPLIPEDVNRDGSVTALDALIGINKLSPSGPTELDATQPGDPPRLFYLDVNGDGLHSALDSLRVINVIASRENTGNTQPEGEIVASRPNASPQPVADGIDEYQSAADVAIYDLFSEDDDDDDLIAALSDDRLRFNQI